MEIQSRISRLSVLLGMLLVLGGLLALSIRFGVLLSALLAVVFVLLLVVFRIAAIRNPEWMARVESMLSIDRALPFPENVASVEPPRVDSPSAENATQRASADMFGQIAQRAKHAVASISTMQENATSDSLSLKQILLVCGALLAFGVPVFLRLFRLDDLQAEVYGDIAIVFEYVFAIRDELRPFNIVLSSGPLYHYLIAPILSVVGHNYFGIKIASVLTSLVSLVALFLLCRRLLNTTFALLAVFVAGVSSWWLIFSRLGNSQIIVPFLAIGCVWLLTRYLHTGDRFDLIASAFVSALGLYAYPQSYVLAPTLLLAMIALRLLGHRIDARAFVIFLAVVVFTSLPFVRLVSADPSSFDQGGYISGKLLGSEQPLSRLINNVVKSFFAYFVKGDIGIRSNPSGEPHVDFVSGALLIAGIAFWLTRERRRWSPLIFIPLIAQHIPAMLVLNVDTDVPSASRTLGAAPFVYILVTSGLWWMLSRLQKVVTSKWITPTIAVGVLGIVLALNIQRYFVEFISGLPYANTPVARIIKNYVDSLPPETNVYLYHCCWESGMPEPKSIRYEMKRPEQLTEIGLGTLTCENAQQRLAPPAVLIWDYHSPIPDEKLASCSASFLPQLHSSADGKPVFNVATVRFGAPQNLVSPLASPLQKPPKPPEVGAGEIVEDDLSNATASAFGQDVFVNHSAIDSGEAKNIFDGNSATLMRGRSANPFILRVNFSQPKPLRKLSIQTAQLLDGRITLKFATTDGKLIPVVREVINSPGDPWFEFDLPTLDPIVGSIQIELLDRRPPPGEGYHMHIRELWVE
jgi:hypothetical protein